MTSNVPIETLAIHFGDNPPEFEYHRRRYHAAMADRRRRQRDLVTGPPRYLSAAVSRLVRFFLSGSPASHGSLVGSEAPTSSTAGSF